MLMKTERQKMLAGELYDPLDAALVAARLRARLLCQRLNALPEDRSAERELLLAELFGRDTDVCLQPPFFCDYGDNISLGRRVFFNFNCVVLDVAEVRIGDHVLFGPAVQLYTATHPLDASARRGGLEAARAIAIGDDVWIGGGAIVCPGVTIGARTVVGAGSVVTRDVPAGVLAAGNPCRVLRRLGD